MTEIGWKHKLAVAAGAILTLVVILIIFSNLPSPRERIQNTIQEGINGSQNDTQIIIPVNQTNESGSDGGTDPANTVPKNNSTNGTGSNGINIGLNLSA